ncbi:hypothetical protein LTR70_001931 [Exophiala xenobiotica]|uniref:Uncharacterized protein n=1 Tax=Lithohypha guttulata TaxID=1690604 RepID=A0ABR0KB21_9EURO|nr:hypothetical protein LTR24_005397 [Lithohypha guttulata]KAK5326916.1 hypothetical protein LTR70_001931 [Exophiala xenobiotica]
MDLDQSASDNTIRVYRPKTPSPNPEYPQILLYAPDLASLTPTSNASSTEAEETLLQTYKVYTERTCEDGRIPQVLWPLVQLQPDERHGSGLHENVLSRCHPKCHIICLLPETVWEPIEQICKMQVCKESLAKEEMRFLCNSRLWTHVAEVRALKPSSTISLFVGDREWPLDDFVRGMNVLADQEEAKDPMAGEWIKKTAVWKLVLPDSNDETGGGEGLRSQQDVVTAANTRQRAKTAPEPPTGEENYTVEARRQPVSSPLRERMTPRTVPKVDMLFIPRSGANGPSGRS